MKAKKQTGGDDGKGREGKGREGKGKGRWVLWSQGRLMCMAAQGSEKSLPYALIGSIKGWVWLRVRDSHGRRTRIPNLCGSEVKWLCSFPSLCQGDFIHLSGILLHFLMCFILCTPVLCSSSLSSLRITCQLDWHVPTAASFSNFARLFQWSSHECHYCPDECRCCMALLQRAELV